MIANEFLDALPIRQLIYRDDAWHERVVDLAPGRQFAVRDGIAAWNSGAVRRRKRDAIVELRAGEDEVLQSLAARAEPHIALFIDYGPAEPSVGDTLQAVRRHAYTDPLVEPGRQT